MILSSVLHQLVTSAITMVVVLFTMYIIQQITIIPVALYLLSFFFMPAAL